MKKVNILKIARVVGLILCVKAAVFLMLSVGNIFPIPRWLLSGLSLLWFLCGVLVLWLTNYVNGKVNQATLEYTIRYRREKKTDEAEGDEKPVATA